MESTRQITKNVLSHTLCTNISYTTWHVGNNRDRESEKEPCFSLFFFYPNTLAAFACINTWRAPHSCDICFEGAAMGRCKSVTRNNNWRGNKRVPKKINYISECSDHDLPGNKYFILLKISVTDDKWMDRSPLKYNHIFILIQIMGH